MKINSLNTQGATILKFLHIAEKLKTELRNGYTSSGRQESVADHTWRLALMIILCEPCLEERICIEKALKIALVHDLPELITGDEPYFVCEGKPSLQKEKKEKEALAMKEIGEFLGGDLGDELISLWQEYNDGLSLEAKLVKALDKMEAQIQHNEMDYQRWNDYDRKFALTRLDSYCCYSPFLTSLKDVVQKESQKKMTSKL